MLNDKLLTELQNYVENHQNRIVSPWKSAASDEIKYSECLEPGIPLKELDDYIKNRKPTFNQLLFSFIDTTGASDSEVYKRAGLDRRHFSKIRSNPSYRPGKNTAIALALALELNKKETGELLSAAGYSLSESDTFYLVIQFCLDKRIYDIPNVNSALDYFSLKQLAGVLE